MMSYFARVAKSGGMITCGGHLGVYVGTDIAATPRAWAFVDLATATPELVAEAVADVKRGREAWPDKEDGSRPTKQTTRRM